MKLRKVTFPKNLTEIFSSAFIYCIKLEHVDLSNTNLRYIQPEAFLGCRSLFSVTLPASVKLIREEAFKYCDNLEEITFLGTVKQWEGIDDLANWGAGSRVKKVTCSDGIFYREDRT